jgi:hypothetical protein
MHDCETVTFKSFHWLSAINQSDNPVDARPSSISIPIKFSREAVFFSWFELVRGSGLLLQRHPTSEATQAQYPAGRELVLLFKVLGRSPASAEILLVLGLLKIPGPLKDNPGG